MDIAAMSSKKRVASQDATSFSSNKKAKLNESAGNVQENLTASEIRSLLTFSQNADEDVRTNIRKFRSFLEVIDKSPQTEEAESRRRSLLEYLKSVVSIEEASRSNVLNDILQTWSLAAHAGNYALLGAITSVLALLLKIISTELSFRRIGISICQTLLNEDNVKIISQSMSASRSHEQVLTAGLRLITEIVSFDGGACARSVYRQRSLLFKRLDELLAARTGGNEAKKGPLTSSLRGNAVRLLLANFRVQEASVKAEILSDPKRVRALVQGIGEDSDSTIKSILETFDKHVLSDSALTRHSKGRLLTENTLSKISFLYTFGGTESRPDREKDVREAAHKFLLKACCTSSSGVLVHSDGWYGPRASRDASEPDSGSAPKFARRHSTKPSRQDRVQIGNMKLSNFIQDLRPYANSQHRELVLAIFKVAPELVADYFIRKKSFSFDPKLTSTWIGFASFVAAVNALPVPAFSSSRGLPSVAVVVENILPSSLTSKSTTRCFNQSSILVRFLTSKLLIAASQRLALVLKAAEQQFGNAQSLPLWKADLLAEFGERCPEISAINAAIRACTDEQVLLRESLLHTVSTLSTTIPRKIVQTNFDASLLLTDALSGDRSGYPSVHVLTIEHLLQTVSLTELDWFRKPERLRYSPFTTTFRLWVQTGGSQLEDLLGSVLYDECALRKSPSHSASRALNATLQQYEQDDALWGFLDNCLVRFMQRPIKYQSELQALVPDQSSPALSLLTVVLLEQWPHFVEAHSEAETITAACWIARWLGVSGQIGEDSSTLVLVRDAFATNTPAYALEHASRVETIALPPGDVEESNQATSTESPSRDDRSGRLTNISSSYLSRLSLPVHGDSYPELLRWSKKSILDAVEEKDVNLLLWCLCAPEVSIRRQGLSQLRSLTMQLQASDYAEKAQLYLLLMEVIETATQHDLVRALPSIVVAIASSAVMVLHDPSHFMYDKVNRFLMKAPEWTVNKLPSYWISKVLFTAPSAEIGDSYKDEADWLLDVLLRGLRIPEDLDLYRRCGVFEHLMTRDSQHSSQIRAKVLDLLWRCTLIEGGSQTLVTRFAVLSWLRGHAEDARFEALGKHIAETCDREKIEAWSEGHMDALVGTQLEQEA